MLGQPSSGLDGSKGRGGPKHHTKPPLDASLVLGIFAQQPDLLRDLGPYESIPTNFAASGQGLLKLKPILEKLLEVCPSAEPPEGALREAAVRMATASPQLLKGCPFSIQVWGGLKTKKLITVFSHLRRLRREPRKFEAACLKLVGPEVIELQGLLNLITLRHSGEDSQATENSQGGLQAASSSSNQVALSEAAPTVGYPEDMSKAEAKALPTGRGLKRVMSDISVDSNGFPMMLRSPNASQRSPQHNSPQEPQAVAPWVRGGRGRGRWLAHPASSPSGPSRGSQPAQPADGAALRANLGFEEEEEVAEADEDPAAKASAPQKAATKKAAAKKPAARAPAPKKAAAQAPAAKAKPKANAADALDDVSYEVLKVEEYTSQSYIKGLLPDGSKSLLISCSLSAAANHGHIMQLLHKEAQNMVRRGTLFRASKALLLAKRAEFLAAAKAEELDLD